ncbi:phosphatidylcholine:ceramide cholinephosphotransferase 1 isoform X2 [Eurytemora carolleeae]|uniref:phosphatidylcholine:ceramide cholinephosphotransferase 1 isoform X2 n=1 Tax=Eurytemora carolleeae TaxID=1294199 RepID=UPI000C77F779|nr:phosphatidylcholine:ceramide cholinephosphotransferase 1 isoform X2 [Eurytemora carolleeae]|eukprot:XP_023332692.1 phosphatidylcholine:ceramide cholinephosphotransferase 1-like isoform X2 [Eurytemora affinis]
MKCRASERTMSGIRILKEENGNYVEECRLQNSSPIQSPERRHVFFPPNNAGSPHTPLLMSTDSEDESESKTEEVCTVNIENAPTENEVLVFPDEWHKTLMTMLFMGLGFIITTFSLILTHERMPEGDPLPDIFLDNVSYISWGLKLSEVLMITSIFAANFVVLAHTHRSIIYRRIFFLLGILYFYRAATFYVTALPKSDKLYHCDKKNNGSLPFSELVSRVVKISTGGGLSINDNQVYCGDFIFSGHTVMLVTSYLAITEYGPARCFLIQWISFFTSLFGVLFLLLARGHYTVDVLIAYILTTRIWWGYHTIVNSETLKKITKENSLSKLWWFRLLRYLEANVPGPIPSRYSFPLPQAWKSCITSKFHKKVKVDSEPETS